MKYFSLLYLFLFSAVSFAQLSLQVNDEHTDNPVEGAHVSLISASDSTYAVTDAEGKVVFKSAKSGEVKITHISYLPISKNIGAGKSNIIYMSPLQTGLDEVVVTGHARPVMASQSVRTIRVIDAQRIDQQGAVNLGELLTNDLNFRVSEDAVLGSQLSLQGLSGSKIKILVDGVPIIGRLDGNIDLNQINLNDIDRVEVVEGPMAVQYGTDAVAGTINLITKRKATNEVDVNLNGYYETVGRYNFDGSVSIPMGKFQGNIGLGRNYFDGYSPDESARDYQWNPKEQYFANASLQRRFSKVMARYRFDYFDENIVNRGAVGSMSDNVVPVDTGGAWYFPQALDDTYRTIRVNNALYADYYPREDMKVKAFVAFNYYQRQKESTIKNLNTGAESIFPGTDAQDTTTFAMLSSRMFYQHDWIPNKLNYQLGYDLSYEANIGQRIEGDFKDITDLAVFATAEYKPVKSLNIQPGLRYAYNSRFDAPLISSLALRYQINEKYVLRASFGQGFRAPSLKEMYFLFVDENHNILGNEGLQAETSNNYQLSLNYSRSYTNANVEASVSGFFNDIKNEIRLVSVISPDSTDNRGLYRNENIARTQTTGGTMTVKTTLYNFQIETGATFIGMKNDLAFTDVAMAEGDEGFNFYPQFRFNINYNFKKIGLRPALFINYTGKRSDLALNSDGDLITTTYDNYTMAEFTIQKSFLKNKLVLTVGAKNLFDVTQLAANNTVSGGAHTAGSASIPLSYGRTYFTRLQWSF